MATSTSIDFIVPTRHDTSYVLHLLEAAAHDPWWMQHTFHFVYDENAQTTAYKLREWLSENREKPLPNVRTIIAPPQATGRPNVLREIGLKQCNNAFVYFQDDDDPLPENLVRCLEILENYPECGAVFGMTETYTHRGQRIEIFPAMSAEKNDGRHIVDGLRIFPTYGEPLSALFRRKVFETTPFTDGQNYQMCGSNAFALALLENWPNMRSLAKTIRKTRQNPDNPYSPVFDAQQQLLLAEDISLWQRYISDPKVRRFHEMIREGLIAGDIGSFRDITALVEQALEDGDIFS